MSKVYIMHGFIGSGKTTFSKSLEKETGAKRFTPDEIISERYGTNLSIQEIRAANLKVKEEIWDTVKTLIQANQDIILDYGLWKKEQRTDMVNKIKQLGGIPIIYEILCDPIIMRERALQRKTSDNNEMTPDLYDTYFERFEPMGDDEERITIKNS